MTEQSSPDTTEPAFDARAPSPPKSPPPPLMGRAPRPRAARIRKPVVQALVGGAAVLLSGSLAWAFVIQPELKDRSRDAAEAERLEESRGAVRPSDRVVEQPASYDRLPDETELPERRGAARELEAADATGTAPAAARPRAPSHIASSTGAEPALQAAASGLFFGGTPTPAPTSRTPGASAAAPATLDPAARNLGALYSPHGLVAPVSPYELKAGAIVPGALLTAIDTARPGPVLATVTQNVFDSITGRHLMVPQGTRLIGRHEGESAHGDRRAFLVWERMILPNGKSLILTEEPGVDGAGAIGIEGETRRRLGALAGASLFAGAITTLGELARGGGDDRSLIASAGDAASIEAAQVGGRLVDRELQVRPSIVVRPGAAVRVMITRDLILEPYRR